MYEQTIKSQDLLNSLWQFREILQRFRNQGKPYDMMLEKILENIENLNTEEIVHLKKVAEWLQVKSDKIRPFLEQIHDDILEYLGSENKPSLVIEKTDCAFVVTDSMHKSMFIDNIKLDHIPHIGETIYFDILRPYFGGMSLFKVDNISHEISLDRHKITIYLRDNVNMFAKWKEEENEYNENRRLYKDRLERLQNRESFTFSKGTWRQS